MMSVLTVAAAVVISTNSFWHCEKLDADGTSFSWTLTSRIGSMLYDAEQMFGSRDKSWTILGCQYCRELEQPENWYPGYPKRKDIVFNLCGKSDVDNDIALLQLSHEVVHALSPKVGVGANVLEEGSAVWFSVWYVKKATGKDATKWLSKRYRYAYDKVSALMNMDKSAVKKLRCVEPCFKNMTSETFKTAKLQIEQSLMRQLLEKFSELKIEEVR